MATHAIAGVKRRAALQRRLVCRIRLKGVTRDRTAVIGRFGTHDLEGQKGHDGNENQCRHALPYRHTAIHRHPLGFRLGTTHTRPPRHREEEEEIKYRADLRQ